MMSDEPTAASSPSSTAADDQARAAAAEKRPAKTAPPGPAKPAPPSSPGPAPSMAMSSPQTAQQQFNGVAQPVIDETVPCAECVANGDRLAQLEERVNAIGKLVIAGLVAGIAIWYLSSSSGGRRELESAE